MFSSFLLLLISWLLFIVKAQPGDDYNCSNQTINGTRIEIYPVPVRACDGGFSAMIASAFYPNDFKDKFPKIGTFQKLLTYFTASQSIASKWTPYFLTLNSSDNQFELQKPSIIRLYFDWIEDPVNNDPPPEYIDGVIGLDQAITEEDEIFTEADFGVPCQVSSRCDNIPANQCDLQHVIVWRVYGNSAKYYRWCWKDDGLKGGITYGDAETGGCGDNFVDGLFDLVYFFTKIISNPPTTDPTNDPTIDPTTDPTLEPTTDPTLEPTLLPTKAPTLDAYSELDWIEDAIIGILAVCIVIAVIGLIHSWYPMSGIWLLCCSCCCYPSDDTNYLAIIRFGLQTTDFVSDINLTYLLSLVADQDSSYNLIYLAALVFVLLPWLANLLFLILMSRKWTNMRATVKSWMRTYTTALVFFTMISGGANSALALVNSKLFGLGIFSMGLPKSLFLSSNRFRVLLTTLLENIPQVIIQIMYGIKSDNFSQSALLLALATSLISILMVIVSACVQLADDYKDKEFEIEFILSSTDKNSNLAKIERRCHMRKRMGEHICNNALNLENSKLLTVEYVKFGAKSITISFELNDEREVKVILDQLKQTKHDDTLADAIQSALQLDGKPIISNIKYVGIASSTTSGEQEMVATQIDSNNPQQEVFVGEEDDDGALEVIR